jgi:hypothetical protein
MELERNKKSSREVKEDREAHDWFERDQNVRDRDAVNQFQEFEKQPKE